MTQDYSEMDSWTSEQVAIFKEDALDSQRDGIEPLVAEGDSWFDYLPGTDIIDCLKRYHGYPIHNWAQAGDTLENMIYGTGITRRFEPVTPSIHMVLRKLAQVKPKVFLFSGGGNDVAGDEFDSFLNHKHSDLPILRLEYLDQMVNVVFRQYFENLISKVAVVSPSTHIIVHGYGHSVPTGEGVNLAFFTFAGPWLRPALAMKRILDPIEQRETVFTVIDQYNNLLCSLAEQYDKFHHVDLRDIIDPDRDWANELHLRNNAFARVAERIHHNIESLCSRG